MRGVFFLVMLALEQLLIKKACVDSLLPSPLRTPQNTKTSSETSYQDEILKAFVQDSEREDLSCVRALPVKERPRISGRHCQAVAGASCPLDTW